MKFLRPLEHWDRGFESRWRHGRLYAFILCLCCPVYVAALQRADHSSKESYQLSISVRLRNLIRGGQGPTWARAPLKKKNI
jgi:hypothetical protein